MIATIEDNNSQQFNMTETVIQDVQVDNLVTYT